ncbi:hypothetical protein M885DRAFT_547174 [Pelagophyceae sp. CCMP2097]|nr:hypothetical protein M885DRAFT_547174 [Pelagophyceae sp. CCMP2097]|mmetsp:Transcript_16663/g.56284  ORF Transcript_16663/g.56284 Transcript_16663/m.56284 type:complete len:368 (+) Transcript_16663:59-1162(+)
MDPWYGEESHSLAVEALEREARRIAALRERDAQRNSLFQSTRRRAHDTKTLAVQCSDNEQRRSEEKALDRKYADMMKATQLLCEIQRHDDEAERLGEMRRLRDDWDAAASQPKNTMPRMSDRIDPDACGLAAVQRLAGEDKDGAKRKQRQQQQLNRWSAQQMQQTRDKKDAEAEHDRRFAEWESHVCEQRAQMDAAERRQQAAALCDLRDERFAAAAQTQAQRRADKDADDEANAAEIARNLALGADGAQFLDPDGRSRPDHYRGLTKAQTKRVYYENALVEQDAERRRQDGRDRDAADARDARAVQLAVEAAEFDKAQAKQRGLDGLRADHELQRELEAQRKADSKRDKFGHVSEGLLTNFGKSYR